MLYDYDGRKSNGFTGRQDSGIRKYDRNDRMIKTSSHGCFHIGRISRSRSSSALGYRLGLIIDTRPWHTGLHENSRVITSKYFWICFIAGNSKRRCNEWTVYYTTSPHLMKSLADEMLWSYTYTCSTSYIQSPQADQLMPLAASKKRRREGDDPVCLPYVFDTAALAASATATTVINVMKTVYVVIKPSNTSYFDNHFYAYCTEETTVTPSNC